MLNLYYTVNFEKNFQSFCKVFGNCEQTIPEELFPYTSEVKAILAERDAKNPNIEKRKSLSLFMAKVVKPIQEQAKEESKRISNQIKILEANIDPLIKDAEKKMQTNPKKINEIHASYMKTINDLRLRIGELDIRVSELSIIQGVKIKT